MTDTELLDYLEFLAHDYTVKLTRDWTYELSINDGETYKGKSIRQCIEYLKNSKETKQSSVTDAIKKR